MTAVLVDERDMPISGRSEPRPQPDPEDLVHEVTYYGTPPGLSARCTCGWRTWLDNGHTSADLLELERQHSGDLS